MANKMVEMTFAIGAALTGSFGSTFGKAGQALGELQKQCSSAQKVAGQIGSYQKMQGAVQHGAEKLNAARMRVKELGQQMKSAGTPTAALKKQFTAAHQEARRLEVALGNQRKKLGELRTELKGANVDVNHLTSEQTRLTQQSKKLEDAQTRLQNSRAALQATRERLSWSNIKGDLIAAAGMGYSLYKPTMIAADFEQAMARTKAVAFTGKNKTPEQRAADEKAFLELQAQARQLGRDTQYTAKQAANSQEMLARAGFKSNEIIAAMPGLLSMAAAEGMDLANAADVAASTLRGFNLEADQSGRVADVLAQMSAASNTSISGLGESMKYVAPVASGLGISLEETAAMIGVMGNAGIKGSQAGTALRAALLRLSKEPKAVAKALTELGVRATDAQGRMRKMPSLMADLSKRMRNMGEARQMKYLTNIFGGEAASGMLAVMRSSLDGTLSEYEQLGKEATGIFGAMAEAVSLSVEEMRSSMKTAEPAAAELGISFRDLSIYTAMLIKNGLNGEDANKSLTALFTRLKKEPKQVTKALQSLKIDTSNLHEIPDLMKAIDGAIGSLSESDQLKALTKIFGKDAAVGMRAMMRGVVDGTIDEFNRLADKATGVSKDMADVMQETLQGQMTIAGSAIDDLMIEIGNVIAPYAKIIVYGFTRAISEITKFMREHPIVKSIIGWVAGISALKVGITALKYSWLAIKLPFLSMRVAMDLLNTKSLENAGALAEAGKKAGLFSKVSGKLSSAAKGIGKAFSAIGRGIGKVFSGIWNMGKSLISGLFSPMGLKILLIAGIIAAVAAAAYLIYKNWDKIKAWWNSWTLKDVFAPVIGLAQRACSYVKQKWNDFWVWWDSGTLSDIFSPLLSKCSDAISYLKGKWNDFKAWIKGVFSPSTFDYMTTPEFMAEAKAAGSPEYHIDAMNSAFAIPDMGVVKREIAVEQEVVPANDISDEVKKVAAESAYIEKELRRQTENVTILNTMSEGFSDRVAEMTRAWQPFKDSLGEGFEQIYSVMQNIADRIRGVTIPAVNELASTLSKIATEISSIVQAGTLEVEVRTPSASYSRTVGGMNRGGYRAHAMGGIFSQPHLGLVAEAGREAVIPLEDKVRGIPLWKAAGEEMGLLFGNTTTNNDNRTSSMNFYPTFNITVNGGEPGTDQRFRRIIEEVLSNMQNEAERTTFR